MQGPISTSMIGKTMRLGEERGEMGEGRGERRKIRKTEEVAWRTWQSGRKPPYKVPIEDLEG